MDIRATRPAGLAPGVLAAGALGAAAGLRSATPVAVLGLRRPGVPPLVRWGLTAAALAEIVADKLPRTPDRRSPPGLAGRITSGTGVGWVAAGPLGGLAGALAAAGATFGGAALRARVVAASGLPDPAVAPLEDLVAVGIAWLAAPAPEPGPEVMRAVARAARGD